MARSKINSRSKDLITDDGAVLVSVVKGEQIQLGVTLNWITNMTGFTKTCKVVEADSANLADGEYPTQEKAGGEVTTLVIADDDVTDNQFKIIIPQDLCDTWTTQPLPEKPSYAWIGLEIRDAGSGNSQQIWKPMRGLVEVLYSPTEAS